MRFTTSCILFAGLCAGAVFARGGGLPEGFPDRETLLEWFQDSGVKPDDGNFVRVGNAFPEIVWERPLVVNALWGAVPITARWFNADLEEIGEPGEPGRYGAYVEARPADGPVIRRGLTVYFLDPREVEETARDQPRLTLPLPGVAAEVQDAHEELIHDLVSGAVLQGLTREAGAILLAGLSEMTPGDLPAGPLDMPQVRHLEHQFAIKRAVLGLEDAHPALDRPQPGADAPELRPGAPADAGFAPGTAEELDRICREWLEASGGQPFTAVVARRGVVVFHEAYGDERGEPVTTDTTYPLHSITKSLSGVLLGLFLDQGLLELDAPIGHVLPDFPVSGPQAVTLRHCATHTTGLEGHGTWGGLNNIWLDSVIAGDVERLEPGRVVRYNGVSFDLMGRVMEVVAGKVAPRIFQEHLFEPLGMKGARVTDMGLGGHLRAIDLARVGQLLLNEGAYGDQRFFSPETFEELLPRPYAEVFPDLDANDSSYGIGIRWASREHPRAGQNGIPEGALTLGERTIGHGAFSSTVFRVDLEDDLVVAIGRIRRGDNLDENLDRFLAAVRDGMADD